MRAIWPGDTLYEEVMEAAKTEYEVWLNRNKTDFVIAKKTEKIVSMDDFELDDFEGFDVSLEDEVVEEYDNTFSGRF
jgi:hypothetical protein